MWNMSIPGVEETLYEYLLWFLVYSILGWVVESTYMSICNKKITNRGFIHGPICPIYGFGGTIVHIAVHSFIGNYVYMFIAGSLLATMFEFITAHIMIKIFGYVWWDYSNKPLNYRGIVCLESSIAWGFYTIIESILLYKFAFLMIQMMPIKIGKVFVLITITYYLIDFAYSMFKVKCNGIESDENNLLQYGMKQ